MSISNRAQRGLSHENILLDCFSKANKNLYNAETNPEGVINMGTSETKLCDELVHERIAQISLKELPLSAHHYCDMRATAGFRKALAMFLDKYMKPKTPIDMDNLFVFNGCGSVIELLGFTICDEGEGVLIPAPYYGAFKSDIFCRMGCIAYSVDLSSSPNHEYGETKPFELSAARLQDAYEQAQANGLKIKAMIMSNPNNPLGCVYSKAQITEYLKFANRHGLHVVLDEIYLLSIHDPEVSMTNGLSLQDVIDPKLLHVVWGFSKDFGISGFRCGLVHTENKAVADVLHCNAYFQSVPTVLQYILTQIVSDFDWLDNVYLPTNQKRLRQAYLSASEMLKEMGVEVLESSAGLYVWVNLKRWTKPLSRDGEMKLMDVLIDNGVYITSGVAFNSAEYGWFRIIVTTHPEALKIGLQRLKSVLQKIDDSSEDKLENLVEQLQSQIKGSDWLKENSAEKWVEENPELAKEFSNAK